MSEIEKYKGILIVEKANDGFCYFRFEGEEGASFDLGGFRDASKNDSSTQTVKEGEEKE